MSKIIIANWKMNLSAEIALKFISQIKKTKNNVVIAPPYTFLSELSKVKKLSNIKLAAQDASQFTGGAYTGEISAQMLKKSGCDYSLVGHSERRIYFQETNEQINQKIKRLLENKIKPILCLGETAEQRNKKMTKSVIRNQLVKSLKNITNPAGLIVAYEPVWAISTFQQGKKPKPAELKDIIDAHLYIKSVLSVIFKRQSGRIKIIYGGTVNPENAADILNLEEVDGALVGGSSLKVSLFNAIIQAADKK